MHISSGRRFRLIYYKRMQYPGYHVTLVTDAVATFSRKEHHTTVAEIYPQIAHAVLDTNQLVNALQTEKVTHDS